MGLCWQSNISAFKYAVSVDHSFPSKEEASFNFMVAVTICSDFGAQENKVYHCFHCFPIYLPWSDGTGCHDLSFLNIEFYSATCIHISLCHDFSVFVSWIPCCFFLPFTTLTFLKRVDQICTAYPPFWVCWFSLWLCSGYAFWFRNTMVVNLKWCCVFLRTSCLTLLTLVTWLSWYPPLDTSLNTGKLVSSFYG